MISPVLQNGINPLKQTITIFFCGSTNFVPVPTVLSLSLA
jgi:hypothetical protein